MPRWLVKLYADELPVLLAADQLRALDTAVYPHLYEGDRKSSRSFWVQRLSRRSTDAEPVAARPAPSALAAMGIKVVREVPSA